MKELLPPSRRPFFYGAVISGLLLLLYRDNLSWLWAKWMTNPDYSHGPMVPLVSLFIVYQKRERLREMQGEGSSAGLWLLAAAFLLQLVGQRGQVSILTSYSLLLYLAGIILYLWGRRIMQELLFPLLYLLFMIPFWDLVVKKVSNVLKMGSSILAFHAVQLLDVPIYREGVVLQMANGALEVADPCSGIRSLISITALGVLIAYFTDTSLAKRVGLVLLGVVLTFIANTVRVVLFAVILERWGVMIEEGFWHTMTGLLVFGFALAGLMGVRQLLLAKPQEAAVDQ